MGPKIRRLALLSTACAALLVLASCGDKGHDHSGDAAHHQAPATQPSAAGGSDGIKLKLAAADALDGTKDQVVTRCSGCRLGMDGKAEHPIQVEGYTLHMCSDACKSHFEKDLQANLAALEIPQS